MELINKLEATVAGWVKNVPHLPVAGQKWLAQNVWWIALIGAIASGVAALFSLTAAFGALAIIGSASSIYYVSSTALTMSIVSGFVSLAFLILEGIVLAVAVKPLRALQKKGWVLLFLTLLINLASSVVTAVLSFSVGGFIVGLIFGALWSAVGAYFIFEIRGQFAHTTKAAAKKA